MEDPAFTVLLTGPSGGGPAALGAVRSATGLSLWRSRRLIDGAPAVVCSDVPFDAATRTAKNLRRAGVAAAVRCGWCRRTVPDDGTLVDPGPCTSPIWPAARCQANSLSTCDCAFCAV
ncbi:ribosomal protein L7/L12 [Kitasatospora hibisci]|uniref:ribosomal protein L7/L12 n=1 Tax=Kitasatospora hibisci TaxID=3369522 RepID=UPI0037544329